MTRSKVKLAFISKESSRKATFKKRKKGLMKKVSELSTLCGIKACAVLYSPYDSGPVVWPSDSDAQRVISEFRALPQMDQEKKMFDQESFLQQRIAKTSEYLKKQRKENRELEMTQVMFQCFLGNMGKFNMNLMDLNDLGFLADRYLKDVDRRFEILQNLGMEIGESSNAAATGSNADIQQQVQRQHLTTPYVGFYDPSRNLNPILNQNQQPWLMETMNRHSHSYHQPQCQQIHGESSSYPAIFSSSGNTPTTDPNPTNNIWFR